jgi:hypothetical protein
MRLPLRVTAIVGAGLAAWFFGCGATRSTGIVIGVSTQARVPKEIQAVRVLVRRADETVSCTTTTVTDPRALPQTELVTGAGGQDLTVTVAGFASPPGGACADLSKALLVRRAHTRMVDGETLYLPMPLRYACFDVTCAEGETCAAGACVSAEIPPETLVDYADPLVFGTTSFCLSESRCFETRVPALLLDRAACVFQLTGDVTVDAGINVEILHDNLSREVLDLDPREGFTVDATKPDRFALAPALCARFRDRRISAVFAGAGCPSKTALNPLCRDDAPEGDAGYPPAEAAELCTSPAELVPAPSALYLLMDRSHSMERYFGDDPTTGFATSFRETLDLALQWPILRKALVGFRFLPASIEDCTRTPNSFGALEHGTTDAVPFGAPEVVHGSIRGLLDPSAVDPLDRPVFLDAVLRREGAYAAFAQLGDASRFAARQLVVLGNRDLWAHCSPAHGDPAALASDARRDLGILTGTLLLAAPDGVDQGGRDPYVDAVSIAHAGTGPFCDGTFDPLIAARGVLSALSDLGSCLYDPPPQLDLAGDPFALFSAKISYFDFLESSRVDVPYSSLCGRGASSSNGWNLDEGRVRLCGQSCRDLRLLLETGALYAIQHHAPPPDVELRYAPRCKE